jgi:hypothetical protein
MDQFLIEYLISGKAWVLIGAGPSTAMGYPSWGQLAEVAIKTAKVEAGEKINGNIDDLMKRKDYPAVFDKIKELIGGPRLLQILKTELRPSNNISKIYDLIARWPVPVYLTTNWDNEISNHLAKVRESYITYLNSEDNFAMLTPMLNGAVIKLHGDLTTEQGIILTKSQYRAIQVDHAWEYWRTKLTSVFQMMPVIIIGHSLTDQNVKHVLEAAKKGAGVNQPVCWIAPDVSFEQRREYLEKYRIRVIPYPNQSGDHSHLISLIEHISDFIPPRLTIHVKRQIAQVSESPLGASAAAPGFFVYNKLSAEDGFENKRVDILLSVIESAIPQLKGLSSFTLQEALAKTGWPQYVQIDSNLTAAIIEKGVELGIIEKLNGAALRLGKLAEQQVNQNQQAFEHLKERFKQSILLRIKRKYPIISDIDASQITSDIEASLIGYFREGGLSLATTLFSYKIVKAVVPSSIVRFITEASTRYDDLLKRQAFCTISVDAFVRSENAERDYLGRIAQGFFSFHALGVYGDVALERLSHAKNTVWLIDSNVQIALLSMSSLSNSIFVECFNKLRQLGIRSFTTDKLFYEVWDHLYFAKRLVEKEGPNSPNVLAAACGDIPYSRSNAFLEGFIHWQAAGKPCEWNLYLFEIFGKRAPKIQDIKDILKSFGIEIINFQDWPGFEQADFADGEQYAGRIAGKILEWVTARDFDMSRDPFKKAKPEAEALIIINKERNGKYYILSEPGKESESWFISDTSILNIIDQSKIIWQPDDFARFIFTIAPIGDQATATNAFELISLSIARSGLSLINDQVISAVFGGVIDQTRINITEQRQLYAEALASKYAESPENLLEQIPSRYRLTAGIQLAEERAQFEAERRIKAEKEKEEAKQEVKSLKKDISKLEKYRKKVEKREARVKPKTSKNKGGKKKKGKNKRKGKK